VLDRAWNFRYLIGNSGWGAKMKITSFVALAMLCIGLSACGSSVARPDVVTALENPNQKLAVVDVTCTAGPDAKIDAATLDRMKTGVLFELEKAKPASLLAKANPDARPVNLSINFTAYDEGNAAARLMLMGLGQMHIDGDITIIDASGKTIGVYKISKQFALGGLVGATTSIKDVEGGFESSVVELVRDPSKTGSSSRDKPKKNLRPL
jgi:hypothetical protein